MNNITNLSFQNLHDPLRYELQIDKMVNKTKDQKGMGALFDSAQEGVPLFSFGYDRRELARTLAISIRNESFRFTPPIQRFVKTKNKNKKRLLYHIDPLDKVVVAVLARFLTEILLPFLNPCVYSYRKGKTAKDEVCELGRYIREVRASDGLQGLYLLQTDISSYSDEINIQETSPLWTKLAEYFDSLHLHLTDYHWYLIKEAIRPTHYNVEGELVINLKGAPTGSPITTVLYNYYVACVDFYMTNEPTLFYARYSDDIIICHPQAEIIESYEDYLHIYLKALSLTLSEKKTNRYYFSPAGNAGIDPKWKGTNRVSLLGFSLNAYGDQTISTARQNKLLTRIRYRIQNTMQLIGHETVDVQGRILCQVINSVLTDTESSGNHTLKALRESADIAQLKQLDYYIALLIAESLAKRKGPKAFRQIPYRRIRQEWGLQSLVVIRNGRSQKLVLDLC